MSEGECKGCQRSVAVHLPEREIQRFLAAYLIDHPDAQLADDRTYSDRLVTCGSCPDVRFSGTTCRHCGCLVAVRARLSHKACPAPNPRWSSQVQASNTAT